jgi:tryptophanase
VVPHADVRFDISLVVPTQSHLVWKKRKQIHGMKLGYEAPFLRHFTAGLEPEPAEAPAAMRS